MSHWTYQVRRDAAVFDDLEPWWNSRPGPLSTPFLRSEWFKLWVSAYLPESASLEVVLVERDGETVLVLPLMRSGIGRAALANSHTDVFDVVGDDLTDAFPTVDDWLRRRPLTRLYRLDGRSALLPVTPNPSWLVDREMGAPYLEFQTNPDGAITGMSKSLLRDTRRRERRLAELGELVYLDNAVDSIPDALDRSLVLESSGWKGAQKTAMIARPETEKFYRALAELARDQGWLRLSALLVAERMVAFQFDLDYGGRRFSLKGGYDEDLAHLSPGKVLQWKSLQAASAVGLSSYEFGGEAEEWKLQWTQSVRPRVNALVTGNRGVARFSGAAARFTARIRNKG